MSLEQVAAAIPGETTIGTISKLEKSEMGLTLDWMQAIAGALGVEPDELIAPRQTGLRAIPILGEIAGGNWREAIEDPQGVAPVPDDVGGPNTFGLRVTGDSMDKIAPEDSIVAVDPDDLDLHERKVYAVANDAGFTTFKRFFLSPARLEPCSTNPEHEPILIGRHPLHLIGRVTFVGIDLR